MSHLVPPSRSLARVCFISIENRVGSILKRERAAFEDAHSFNIFEMHPMYVPELANGG
jgi:hypothetical protein